MATDLQKTKLNFVELEFKSVSTPEVVYRGDLNGDGVEDLIERTGVEISRLARTVCDEDKIENCKGWNEDILKHILHTDKTLQTLHEGQRMFRYHAIFKDPQDPSKRLDPVDPPLDTLGSHLNTNPALHYHFGGLTLGVGSVFTTSMGAPEACYIQGFDDVITADMWTLEAIILFHNGPYSCKTKDGNYGEGGTFVKYPKILIPH